MTRVKLLTPDAKLPFRANPTDAGADLFSPIDVRIMPYSSVNIPLGFQIELPKNTAGFIFARSGLGTRFGVRPRNCVGVIDEKYRGEVAVVLENHSDSTFKVSKGDRVAQLVIMPVYGSDFVQTDQLDMDGDRNGGFGSSGK